MEFVCVLHPHHEKTFVRDSLRQVMAEFGRYRHYAWSIEQPPAEADYLAVLDETDVLLTGWGTPRLPLSYLERPQRRLRYICNLTGSIQACIPKEYLARGIPVTNWGDGPMWYLAEGNLALILACTRELPRLRRHMLEQPQWVYPYAAPSPTLRRKTVGFVGFGMIGRVLRNLLQPFECKVLVYDPYAATLPDGVARAASLPDLFSRADVVTIQCGLSVETTGMINRALLNLLRPHAIFINTARGRIVVEKDLIEFLQARPDVFAGLDVFEVEPLPKDSPLLQLDNVICYPHSVGGGGEDSYRAAAEYAADNLRAFCTGQPLKAQISVAQYDRMT